MKTGSQGYRKSPQVGNQRWEYLGVGLVDAIVRSRAIVRFHAVVGTLPY